MALVRWDPMRELEDMQNRLNRLFGISAAPAGAREESFLGEWSPRVDIQETDTEFLVKADLPEVKKDDVKVALQDGVLTVQGERKREKEEKSGEKVIRSERYFGQVQRSFTLQSDIDEGRAEAKFTDGVLNLSLPKRAPASARRLTIS